MLTRRVFARSEAFSTIRRGTLSYVWHDGSVSGVIHKLLSFRSTRAASSSSSTRWKARQAKDRFAKDAKVKGLMSRAAFKLLEINDKHRLFRPGNTVVDLGYAPGSWSQVAVSKTQPKGRVLGIDIIPAQPPRGVSTIQGDFLDPEVQAEVRDYIRDTNRGRPTQSPFQNQDNDGGVIKDAFTLEELERAERSYIDLERQASTDVDSPDPSTEDLVDKTKKSSVKRRDTREGRVVDVVLSDMSAPWSLLTGQWVNSISNPYHRMMNTSGVAFRDHAGSMDLCHAALAFCFDTLRTGGHFVCKFYQGGEDKELEKKLRVLFDKVHREKPEASRDASKESYFIALRRKADVERHRVLNDG